MTVATTDAAYGGRDQSDWILELCGHRRDLPGTAVEYRRYRTSIGLVFSPELHLQRTSPAIKSD
jgi:hypothetical protein